MIFGLPISVVVFQSYCKEFEFCGNGVIPQIARAIGVVPWCWVTCWGAICEFVGAMVGCYCCGVPFEAEADL